MGTHRGICALLGVAVLALSTGCAEVDEEGIDAQTPAAVHSRDFLYGRSRVDGRSPVPPGGGRDLEDQPSTVYAVERPARTYRAEPIYPMEGYSDPPPRRSISFGYIGDSPVGRYDAPQVHEQWWRPFPPDWSRSTYDSPDYGYADGSSSYGYPQYGSPPYRLPQY